MEATAYRAALDGAVALILRPLCRVLLSHGVSYGAFEAVAKRVYVQVALDDFGIPGRKPSMSRASILSGLSRKEVQHLLAEPLEAASDSAEHYNRAVRVTTGWLRDSRFADGWGTPRLLEFDGDDGFAELVRRYSGDMPVRAVLDELLRVGAVREHDDGRLELLNRGYVPQHGAIEKIAILGSDVADLIETIAHNLHHGDTDPRFQRKVMYRNMPVEALTAFRRLGSAQSQALLEKLDRWLAEHECDGDDAEPRARVGVGVYYFEEPARPAAGQTGGVPR